MAFSDLEFQAVKNEVEKFIELIRPPEMKRDKVDIIFSIQEQSVEFFEVRRMWQSDHSPKCEILFAKVTYCRTTDMWRLYFMKGLDWHQYSAFDFVMLEDALTEIWADPAYNFL